VVCPPAAPFLHLPRRFCTGTTMVLGIQYPRQGIDHVTRRDHQKVKTEWVRMRFADGRISRASVTLTMMITLSSKPFLNLLILLLTSSTFGCAFVLSPPACIQASWQSKPQQRQHTDLRAVELVFNGDCTLVSDPLPRDVTKEELIDFLHKKESRNYFFSAGETRAIDELELTAEFKRMWQDECNKLLLLDKTEGEFMMPNDDVDSVIGCEAKINFPGLLLTSTTLSGVKKINEDGHDDGRREFPEYHVLGIAEQQRVEGPSPVVWLYRQLTGLNKKEKGKFYPPSASARSTISIVDTTKDGGGGYAFCLDVKLKIVTMVPDVLVKILPTSKEKMEEQGGAAVSKTVSKDMEASMKHVHKVFVEGRKVVALS
jgi:hypothetical protein